MSEVTTSQRKQRPVDDPIEPIMMRVERARAICLHLALAAESYGDMEDAIRGVADLLYGIVDDLDPKTFRAAVLASEPAEVANGEA